MLRLLIPVFIALVAGQKNDPASKQLAYYLNSTTCSAGILTTGAGAPVEYMEATYTINSDIMDNEHLMENYMSILKKNIPERVVHAPGAGAFGYFVVTHDVSHIIKSKFLDEIGKETPVACRFSPGFSSKGVSDTVRESRGHAFKFYTEEGNYDLTLLNQPVFAVKDPVWFPSFATVLKQNPVTNLIDYNMLWDFVSHRPETVNQFLRILSHQGMPRSYRHMRGFGIHTNQVYNATGHSHFVRFYVLPDAGEKYWNLKEANELAKDRDYYARDLYNEIAKGNGPSYSFKMQIIPESDAFDPEKGVFDVTRELYFEEYPLHPIGTIYLNRNPTNYHAEIEQLAFSPGNRVPGILGGLDKIHLARTFAYKEAADYRLGSNCKKITVNAPIKRHTYIRDGVPPVGDNEGDGPTYYPNSFNGPKPYIDKNKPKRVKITESPEPTNAYQIVHYISKTLNSKQRSELIEVIVENLCYCEEVIKTRSLILLTNIYPMFGKNVTKALKDAKCIK